MDKLEQQLQAFWENRTTPEQQRDILRQLEHSGVEWKDFLQEYYTSILAGATSSELEDDRKQRVWQRLHELHLAQDNAVSGGIKEPVHRVQISWLPWMAAASIILIIGLCIFQFSKKTRQDTPLMEQPMIAKTIVKKNAAEGEISLVLPDGSFVQLAPGSSIRYLEHFGSIARNIQLEGQALFDVAKDSLRPFTVTAHGFATTALGTRFIVDATRPILSIRLLKGKIVVNATADAGMVMQKIYLNPGQELRINTATKYFHRLTLNGGQPRGKPADGAVATALSFERTSLAVVFQRLGAYYKTPIVYDKAEVQGLSFTGDFKPSDELDLALRVICNMNKMSFTNEGGHIVISKQQ